MSTPNPSSSSSNPANVSVQLIDEFKTYNLQTSSYLENLNIDKCGQNYHVVSIFGSQSTGKSTLLNALFGTRFDVMDDTRRSQTTRGIWMSLASTSASTPNILVLDVEGTDGRERGEDQDFERKSALFVLATSEVLIVNMWENQVGLYNGANMVLLKTVFEVNLTLFQADSTRPKRSRILFVIRDHFGNVPLVSLQNTLTEDLEKIWKSLPKPPVAVNTNLNDFFDLQFFGLPNKIYLPEKFENNTDQLSQYFTDNLSSSYVFKPEYHCGVPIDGWPMYSENIWEKIKDNKDLDLPTQQTLVARLRCDEIATQALKTFDTALKEAQKATNNALGGSNVVEGFGRIIKPIRSETLNMFDSMASRYEKSVYISKRATLLDNVDTRLTNLYKPQLLALHNKAVDIFNNIVSASIEDRFKSFSFLQVMNKARSDALTFFVSTASEASVDPDAFTHITELSNLETKLDGIESKTRHQEIEKILTLILKKIKTTLTNNLEGYFRSPEEDTWDKVLIFFNNTIQSAVSSTTKLPTSGSQDFDLGVGASPEENKQRSFQIKCEAWIALDSQLKKIITEDNILLRLKKSFQDLFKYEKNAMALLFQNDYKVGELYLNAKTQVLKNLCIYSEAVNIFHEPIIPEVDFKQYYAKNGENSNDFDVEDLKFSTRLSVTRKERIELEFKEYADTLYDEAKNVVSQANMIRRLAQFGTAAFVSMAGFGW